MNDRPKRRDASEHATPREEMRDTSSSGVRRRGPRDVPARDLVLVVSDDPLSRAALVRELLALDREVLAVDDPQLALAVCVRERPKLLIVDIDAAVMSATKLARLIRLALADEAPRLAVCADAALPNAPKAPNASRDFDAVLDDPVPVWQLEALLDSVLPRSAADD